MSTEPVQSPIALQLRDAEIQDDATPLEYVGHWDKVGGSAEIVNTGSSVMITLPNRNKKPYIIGGPLKEKFIFEQIHFHWVSRSVEGDQCDGIFCPFYQEWLNEDLETFFPKKFP